jgi:hypothetical protein
MKEYEAGGKYKAERMSPRFPIRHEKNACFWASGLFLALLLVLPAWAVEGGAGRPQRSQPDLRIDLGRFGYTTPAQDYRLLGYSMMSVSFVDDRHVLFTFNARKLMRRIPNDPPDDNDQVITALLLELPTGKVLAQTDWRMHDHAQYLWSLGGGRFLLRQGRRLGLLDPLAQLHRHLRTQDAAMQPLDFLTLAGPLQDLQMSPDRHLLIVETRRTLPPVQINVGQGPSGAPSLIPRGSNPDSAAAQQEDQGGGTDVQFFELNLNDGHTYSAAGHATFDVPVVIPALETGVLRVVQEEPRKWLFRFGPLDSSDGAELFDYISGCRPSAVFLDTQRFLTLGCDDDNDFSRMSVFDLQGDALWQQKLSGSYIWPKIVTVPQAARFVLSRVLTPYPVYSTNDVSPQLVDGQELSVLDTRTGALALRMTLREVFHDGNNFSLAPDGSRLAVVAGRELQIYDLPPVDLTPVTKK